MAFTWCKLFIFIATNLFQFQFRMIFKPELSTQSNWQQLSGLLSMKSRINFKAEHYWQHDWNSVGFNCQVCAERFLQPTSSRMCLHGTVVPEVALSQICGAGCDPEENALLALLTW